MFEDIIINFEKKKIFLVVLRLSHNIFQHFPAKSRKPN